MSGEKTCYVQHLDALGVSFMLQEINKRYEYRGDGFYVKTKYSNMVEVGERAGSITDKGYRLLFFRGRRIKEHHLVWILFHGRAHVGELDHKNGVRDDNRIDNLREVSRRVNIWNRHTPAAHNPHGLVGVEWCRGKFISIMTRAGKRFNLGNFTCAEDAHKAYMAASQKYLEQAIQQEMQS